MFGKKGSKIPKWPSVRNCFTLAMTNKLVVIINGLKVPKIKKILLYEFKFLVWNYSCLQNPWLGGYRPQIPVLCPQLNLLNPPQNKIPGYATGCLHHNLKKVWFSFGHCIILRNVSTIVGLGYSTVGRWQVIAYNRLHCDEQTTDWSQWKIGGCHDGAAKIHIFWEVTSRWPLQSLHSAIFLKTWIFTMIAVCMSS